MLSASKTSRVNTFKTLYPFQVGSRCHKLLSSIDEDMVPELPRAAAGSYLNCGLDAHIRTSRMVDPVGWLYTTSGRGLPRAMLSRFSILMSNMLHA